MRDRETGLSEKSEAARRRARRRRERQSLGDWLVSVMERFQALTARQRFLGMVAVAFLVLVLSIAVILPGLAAREQKATHATQTAVAAILLPVANRTSTPTPEPTPTPPPMACVYQAMYGDSLGAVLDGFGTNNLEFPAPYFYFEECSLEEAPAVCSSKQPIPDIDLIEPGWWIELPGADRQRCERNDGLWVEVQ